MSKEFKKLATTVIISAVIFFNLGMMVVKVSDNNQTDIEKTTKHNTPRELSEPVWFELNNVDGLKEVVTEVESFDGDLSVFETNFSSKRYEVTIKDNHNNTKNYLFVSR